MSLLFLGREEEEKIIIDGICRLNPLAAGLNLNPGMKNDASNKEIEEAMKRVREAQSLISAAIEPGSEFSISSCPLWRKVVLCDGS